MVRLRQPLRERQAEVIEVCAQAPVKAVLGNEAGIALEMVQCTPFKDGARQYQMLVAK